MVMLHGYKMFVLEEYEFKGFFPMILFVLLSLFLFWCEMCQCVSALIPIVELAREMPKSIEKVVV